MRICRENKPAVGVSSPTGLAIRWPANLSIRFSWSVMGLVLLVSLAGCKKNDFADPVESRHDDSLPVFESSSTDYNAVTTIEPAPAPVFEEPVAAAPMPVAPVVPVAPTTMYTVVRGDTLWSIANRYYGDGKRWRDIAQANGIHDPRKLVVGEQLTLP